MKEATKEKLRAQAQKQWADPEKRKVARERAIARWTPDAREEARRRAREQWTPERREEAKRRAQEQWTPEAREAARTAAYDRIPQDQQIRADAVVDGNRFGKLEVIIQRLPREPGTAPRALCLCDCGAYATPKVSALAKEKGTKSCGCKSLRALSRQVRRAEGKLAHARRTVAARRAAAEGVAVEHGFTVGPYEIE